MRFEWLHASTVRNERQLSKCTFPVSPYRQSQNDHFRPSPQTVSGTSGSTLRPWRDKLEMKHALDPFKVTDVLRHEGDTRFSTRNGQEDVVAERLPYISQIHFAARCEITQHGP